jgi:phosphatidylglycerol:prolipoprotein diacylglycerol transferase
VYPDLALTSTLHIATYYVIISIAAIIGAIWFIRRAEKRNLSRVRAIDLTLTIMICGFLGARLFHVFYEEPHFYFTHPLKAFEIWLGGYVFFGGLIGAVFGAAIFCEWKREPFWFWADTAVVPISLTYALGRIACFFNGCCYGKYCQVPWGVWMHGGYRHPTQLYASFWEFATLAILLSRESKLRRSGQLFALWLVLHGLGRIMMEHFRDDFRGQLILGQSISTWLSVVFILTGAWVLSRGTQVALSNR